MGFKPCPLGYKDDTIQLADGQAVFHGGGSQCKTSAGAVGDDPSSYQESTECGQSGNPCPSGQ